MKDILGKLLSFIRQNHLLSKIVLVFVLLVIVPGTAVIYFYYRNATDIMHGEFAQWAQQTLKQIEMNISYKLGSIENASNIIAKNQEVHDILSSENTTVTQQIDEESALSKLFSTVNDNVGSFRIRFFVDDSKIYANENVNFFPVSRIKSYSWYDQIEKSGGLIYWKPTYAENYLGTGDVNVISCARLVKNMRNFRQNLGVLVIDLTEDTIAEILANVSLEGKKQIFLTDENGIIISSLDKNKLGQTSNLIKSSLKSLGSEGIIENKDGIILPYRKIPQTGWLLAAEMDYKNVSGQKTLLFNISLYSILALIIYILVVFIITGYLIEEQIKKVKEMLTVIQSEGVESVSAGGNVKGGDIIKLRSGLDNILEKLHWHMKESYESKVKEREAMLKALQAQINPHFLYNTLDTINWMAIKHNNPDIATVVELLARYFRLSLNKGRDIVGIKDEITMAEVYLSIQKYRFDDMFTLQTEIDEEIYNYTIPKLSLQPLVENALLHGIQNKKDKKGIITIKGSLNDGFIELSVTDDGIGMDEDMVKKLLLAPSSAGGYGLFNVNERIKIFSGDFERSGIFIESKIGVGTTVRMVVKAVKELFFLSNPAQN